MNEIVNLKELSEQEFSERMLAVATRSSEIRVTNDAEYDMAGEYAREVKRQQNSVTEFFEPMRVTAKATYDAILSRRKALLDPLKSAESAVKSAMSAYATEKRKLAEAEQAEARRRAMESAKQKEQEALMYSDFGDRELAELAMAEATAMRSVADAGVTATAMPKTDGVSVKKSWRIVSIDPKLVPVEFDGVEIRPVDEKAVARLIKNKNGKVEIPGIVFEETSTMTVRR